jgi:hypothetical protein
LIQRFCIVCSPHCDSSTVERFPEGDRGGVKAPTLAFDGTVNQYNSSFRTPIKTQSTSMEL